MSDIETKRNLIISLHLEGKTNIQIRRQLPSHNLTENFVYRTITRYKATGSVKKRYGGGRKATVVVRENIEKVRKRIQRNPARSARQIARDTNISEKSVRRILKNKLKVKPFKKFTAQDLSKKQKDERLKRCKQILALRRSQNLPNLVFSDEKTFCVEQFLNRQNDRVWLSGSRKDNQEKLRVTRKQGAAQIMVWAAVSENARTPLIFMPMGAKAVKINQHLYRENVLEAVLKPWAQKEFGSEPWSFQQDSAPSHRANGTQEWLEKNVPHFINRDLWPANSPDLNPLDYCLWSILEANVCSKKHTSLDALKCDLRREWAKIDQDVIRRACQAFEKRLAIVVKNKDSYITEE